MQGLPLNVSRVRKRSTGSSKINIVADQEKIDNLCEAAWNGNLPLFKTLIEGISESDINSVNSQGQPALYCAARQGHSAIVLELLNSRAIKKNIIVEQHGGTALHGAVTGQHLEVIALLLVAGVDDTITNKLGLKAAQEAGASVLTVFELFVSGGTEALKKAYPFCEGYKPQQRRPNLELLLPTSDLSPFASPKNKSVSPRRKLSMPSFFGGSKKQDSQSDAAPSKAERVEKLCQACWDGDYEEFSLAWENIDGDEINAPNARGQHALYCAAKQGHVDILIELLNSKGINVNQTVEQHGGTALHAAVSGQLPEVTAILLCAGIDLTIQNKAGITAMQEASYKVVDVFRSFEDGGIYSLQKEFPSISSLKPYVSYFKDIPRGTFIKGGDVKYSSQGVVASVASDTKVQFRLTTDTLQITPLPVTEDSKPKYIMTCDIYEVKLERYTLTFKYPCTSLLTNDKATFTPIVDDDKRQEEAEAWLEAMVGATRSHLSPNISFAPQRHNTRALAFVGGSEYFSTLADYLLLAQSQILISDWWFSPRTYLKRNPLNEDYRLDLILQQKAREGVQICILIFNPLAVLPLNQEGVKSYMESLHESIQVVISPRGEALLYSHHQKFVAIDHEVAFVGGIDLCNGRFNVAGSPLNDSNPKNELFPGHDYYNPSLGSPDNSAHNKLLSESKLIQTISKTKPRMPWQDVQVMVTGEPARDVVYNFIHRWNCQLKRDENTKQLLCPDFSQSTVSKGVFKIMDNILGTAQTEQAQPISHLKRGFLVDCLVVRSIDFWSAGGVKERSCLEIYNSFIPAAQRFIYIESQFFISDLGSGTSNKPIENNVSSLIVQRIKRAYDAQEPFKVFIIIPLHPEGSPLDSNIKAIMYWQYRTISRGKTNLFDTLKRECPGIEVDHYISFFSLYTHDTIGSEYLHSQIYVHSKLLIVDDRLLMVGSQNINDRSLIGARDSELAVAIWGNDYKTIQMGLVGNTHEYSVCKFVHNFRMRLWSEHLQIKEYDLFENPIAAYNHLWVQQAKENTSILDSVFPSKPQNAHKTFSSLDLKAPTNEQEVHRLSQVKGKHVLYPLQLFITDHKKMRPTIGDEELIATMLFPFLLVVQFFVASAHYDAEHFTVGEPRYYPNNMPDYLPGNSTEMSPQMREKMGQMLALYSKIVTSKMLPPGSQSGDANSWDCYGGSCGAAMVFYKMSLKIPQQNQTYLDIAASFIDYSLSHVKVTKNIGLLRGATGVYAICALIHRSRNVEKSNWCIQQLNASVALVSQSKSEDFWSELDFGRAGIIMAALSITESGFWPRDIIPRAQILQIAFRLFQDGVEMGEKGHLAWTNAVQPYKMWGQNHGSTGILQQFFRLPEMFQNRTVVRYIRNTLDYFLTLQYSSGNFPTPLRAPYPTIPDILIQWCHGGPAFIPVMGEAYLRFRDERYYTSMQRAVDNMWEKGLLTKGLMLCHGISGNTYMFFYAYRIKGDPKYLYRAIKFQEFVLKTPSLSDPTKMVQNYPWVLYGSSYLSALPLWSDMLFEGADFKQMHMPGFALTF